MVNSPLEQNASALGIRVHTASNAIEQSWAPPCNGPDLDRYMKAAKSDLRAHAQIAFIVAEVAAFPEEAFQEEACPEAAYPEAEHREVACLDAEALAGSLEASWADNQAACPGAVVACRAAACPDVVAACQVAACPVAACQAAVVPAVACPEAAYPAAARQQEACHLVALPPAAHTSAAAKICHAQRWAS